MAEEFQTAAGTCSSSWWSTARTSGFDGLPMATISCSTSITSIGNGELSWGSTAVAADLTDQGKALSGEEPAGSCSGSGSSITNQDTVHKAQANSDHIGIAGVGSFIDSTTLHMGGFGLPSPGTLDWSRPFFRGSGRSDSSGFQTMLQESNQDQTSAGDFTANLFKDMNQNLLLDQHNLTSGREPGFPLSPSTSYGLPSPLLQSLLEPDTNKQQQQQQQHFYNNQITNYNSNSGVELTDLSQQSLAWGKFPNFTKNNLPPSPKQAPINPLQFSNNTPFWNASTAGFYPPATAQFSSQNFDQKPLLSAHTAKSNTEGARDSGSVTAKKGVSEPAFKKPRIETPSPLPTFKVRKEKLGDRITALQQLVSPFGKTDTASVLHEAIVYIKFLHEQVGVLSTPYLNSNGNPMQNQQGADKSKDGEGPKQDLRSRGLCLVPISSTYPVASETPADFWTPTFGGTYR